MDKREDLPASGRQTSRFDSSDRQQLRSEKIPTAYTVGELSAKQWKQLDDLLEEYQDLFDNNLGRCGIEKHSIDTKFARPIKQHAYQRPPAEKKIIKEKIQKMLEKGVIQESSSP